jgi:hypothetical protein
MRKFYVSSHTLESLRDCLAATAPVDLLGMRLLRASPQPGLCPGDVPRETLKEAVSEIVDYTGRCVAAAQRLSHLAPIPLTTIACLEFGL